MRGHLPLRLSRCVDWVAHYMLICVVFVRPQVKQHLQTSQYRKFPMIKTSLAKLQFGLQGKINCAQIWTTLFDEKGDIVCLECPISEASAALGNSAGMITCSPMEHIQ